MIETLKQVASWLTTSGIKIIGIPLGLLILSQMSKWIVKWMGIEMLRPHRVFLWGAPQKEQ